MKTILVLFILLFSSSVLADDKVLYCGVSKFVGLTSVKMPHLYKIDNYSSQLENNSFVIAINKNNKTITFSNKWINQFNYTSIYSTPFKILTIDEIPLESNSSAIDKLSDESIITAIDSMWRNTILVLDIDEGTLRIVGVRIGDITILDANCDTV